MASPSRAIEEVQLELAEIAERVRTDKGRSNIPHLKRDGTTVHQSAKRHTDTYARFFADLRHEPLTLLEIGVAAGASLRMWEEFFPAARIVGVDINQSAARHASTRTRVHIGDQCDAAFLHQLARSEGPFHIVIDDGGHQMEQHRASLQALWSHLVPGGFYAIEDLLTAYVPAYEGGYLHENTTIEHLKRQIDFLNGQAQAPHLIDGVEAIWFARGLALLCKAHGA